MPQGDRAVIYARCARVDQGQENPFTLQLTEAKTYAQNKGYEQSLAYTDVGSGMNKDRSGLQQLLADAKEGKFDVVIVTSYDRLSRSMDHLAVLIATLSGYGIRVESVTQASLSIEADTALQTMLENLHAQVDMLEQE